MTTMVDYVQMYNNLPSIEEADERFLNREETFAKLAPLLAEFNHQFGVCLLHAHCKLQEGEKMIAQDNITQPELAPHVTHFPDRWLPNGQPFEFTTVPTASPPAKLLTEFQKITGPDGVLGLYYKLDEKLEIEHTEGRKNIMQEISDSDMKGIDHFETAWLPTTDGAVVLAGCSKSCRKNPSNNKHFQAHNPRR
jgi:hypothetical protein